MSAPSGGLPTGRVALLFSDVEGSTALLTRLGDAYEAVLDQHDQILRAVFAAHGGHEFSNEGDAFGAAFADPAAAATAALRIQSELERTSWPGGERVRVRMGLHLGEPKLRGEDYWGEDVHFAARLCSAAHGGQVILSAATRDAVPHLPVASLGDHGLKDFPTPRELFQLLDPERPPEQFPAPRTLTTVRTNLPSIATPLFGRDDVLAELAQLLDAGRRSITLVGPGGMGKTRVAVALGERVAPHWADGVAFVSLAAATDHQVAAAVADATGAPRDASAAATTVVEHLRRRRMLLVLDNCEHLAGSVAALVTTVLEGCPGVSVLATSQVPLDLSTETVVRLPPLALPEDPAGGPGAALTMFVERARARDASFTVTKDQEPLVADLCRLLDGLPLALELAAARVRLTGLERLVTGLRRDLDHLGRGAQDLPDRQRSLRAALDWTLSLLSPTEREVFTWLAAFAESWSIEQAEQLLAGDLGELEVWDALTRLADASLGVVQGDGRFAMPERVRRHAVELLDGHRRQAEIRRRQAEVVGQEVRELALETYVDYRRTFANLVDLVPEAVAALAWARRADPDAYRHLVGLTAHGLAKTGRLPVVSADIPGLAPTTEEPESYDDAAIWFALGQLHAMRWSTDTEGEARALELACRGFRRFGDPRETALAALLGAWALDAGGQAERARARYEEVRAAVESLADRRWPEEMARAVLQAPSRDDHDANEQRRRRLETLGIGAGMYSTGYLMDEAIVATHRGDTAAALLLMARSLREAPRQQLYLVLNMVKQVAWLLAETGEDEQSAELSSAVGSTYRSRTGSDHGDLLPEWTAAFTARDGRLGSRLPPAQARGALLSYDELVERAVEYAERAGSAPPGEGGAQLSDGVARPGAVGAVDPHH